MEKSAKSISLIFLAVIITLTSINPITVYAKNTEDIINSASLKPIKTNYEPLDKLVQSVLKKYTNDTMSTYEKVKACYDYLIKNISYSSNIFDADAYSDIFYKSGYKSEWDKKIAYYAYCALKSKKESCYGYSSAFAVLTRAIGLESYVMQGQTALSKGGYGNHWWVNIKINGKYYVFDPNVDSNIAKGGTIYYYRFCRLDSEVPDKYIYKNRKKDAADFNEFLSGSALKSIKLSKSSITLYKNDSGTLTVKYSPKGAQTVDKVLWKSSNKKVAVVKNGKITAKAKGTAYITAAVGNKTAKCKVTVKEPYIKLNKMKISIKKGKSYKLKAKISSNLESSDLKWKTSNKKVVSISKDGKITAIKKGKATVTAYIGSVKAKCKITVK